MNVVERALKSLYPVDSVEGSITATVAPATGTDIDFRPRGGLCGGSGASIH